MHRHRSQDVTAPPRIGIDLGGTKIEGIVLDDAGEELRRKRIASPRNCYASTVRAICDLVHELERPFDTNAHVGVGIPGAVSPATGLVKNANSTWCNGRPLAVDLSRALEREVRTANDANCLAVSEASDGAGAGCGLVFAVILGTGVGGGIAIDGKPRTGPHAIAGEWGHNPLPWPSAEESPGPSCYCGKAGCIETFLSGPALSADHALRHSETLTPERIIERLDIDDPHAVATWQRYVDRLARALAHVANILDPDVIVLGGGLSNIGRLYEALPTAVAPYVFSDVFATPIRRATHGDSSGVRGAAWLW
ncbi:MAG: ROK family protein [Pseudomonadota bacterium]